MQYLDILKSKSVVIVLLLSCVFFGCSKEEVYRPGIPKGTRFPTLTINGFALDSVQVRIGPKSIVAGYLFEDISANTFKVPFDTTQTISRVVMYNQEGSTPYTGSQFRFENKYRDTSLSVFFDGKTIEYNPVLPKPSAGKMGLRINFRSTASNYRGPVDIEIHERYLSGDDILIKPEAQIIRNVKRAEFSPYVEINAPTTAENFIEYVFYIRVAGTSNPLTYPKGVAVTEYDVLPFQPDVTSLLTITDIRLVLENPNKIIYSTTDRGVLFPQQP